MQNKQILQIEASRPFHAYMFLGSIEEVDSFTSEFIETLGINEADLCVLDYEDSVKINDIRILQHQIRLKPHSSPYKIAVIRHAEKLTLEASNALLKTLEEPSERSIIILQFMNYSEVLPTIASRCRKIKLNSVNLNLGEVTHIVPMLEKMTLKERFDYAQKISKNDKALSCINDLIIYYREKLVSGINVISKIRKIQRYENIIKKFTINDRLVLENIFMEI